MPRKIETQVVNGDGSASLYVDCERFDYVCVTFQAKNAIGTNLNLRPEPFPSNYTGAPVAPIANESVSVGIGPGCDIPCPPPSRIFASMDCVGGSVTIRVEGTISNAEDSSYSYARESFARKLDDIITRLADILVALMNPRK